MQEIPKKLPVKFASNYHNREGDSFQAVVIGTLETHGNFSVNACKRPFKHVAPF